MFLYQASLLTNTHTHTRHDLSSQKGWMFFDGLTQTDRLGHMEQMIEMKSMTKGHVSSICHV